MNRDELKNSPAVRELAELQAARGLPDNDFARAVKLDYSGSTWGKIKAGTHAGNCENALAAVTRTLVSARVTAGIVDVDEDGAVVILPHMRDAADAVQLARTSQDEHRLVLIVGQSGSGKSVTARTLERRYGGTYVHAHPSWARSYMHCLAELSRQLGLGSEWRGAGDAERGILDSLARSPRLIIIDEANHFSRDAINFLKTILNETRCALVLCTLPNHLARLTAEHAEESRQLIRRAVAIVHIPAVSSADVMALQLGLYPNIHLNGSAPAVASCSNRLHRMDTVRRIFDDCAPGDMEDLPRAIQRVERMIQAVKRA